jgi:predicted ester cyclase
MVRSEIGEGSNTMTTESNKALMQRFTQFINTASEELAGGDKVAARFTMRGTHKGTFYGVPPTGREIGVKAMNIYRFSNGKILEEHGQPDLLGLLQQIGAVPTSIAS